MKVLTLKETHRLAMRPDRDGQVEVIDLLLERIKNEHGGSIMDFANTYDIHTNAVYSTLDRKSRPHYLILNHLGFTKVISYRKNT